MIGARALRRVAGAFGLVWKIEHKLTRKSYACKHIEPHSVSAVKQWQQANIAPEQLITEIGTMMAGGGHPHVVTPVAAYYHDMSIYLIMDLVGSDCGGPPDLESWIETRFQAGQVPTEQEVRTTIRHIASGLKHMKDVCGLLHRDIKPSNILCNVNAADSLDTVRVTDFG